ncbi:MAG: DUF4145 domain-containing protein [Dysgonamonadaceae bacterium]|nr:DUF4145 domain-containing protein [Dysgonamonadaceae bacterium]
MTQKNTSPDSNQTSFTCPHCYSNSFMRYETHHFQNDIISNGHGALSIQNQLKIARCENCGRKIIWIDDIYVYPDLITQEANEDVPASVKQLYNEAGLIYNKSPRAACALLRLAIEKLCNELGETDRDINKNIASLVNKGLPSTIQKALDIVRVVGNKAVHPGQIAFDVDDKDTAIMLMKLVNIITKRMITEPKEIDSLYDKLPDSIKESVENRDIKMRI